MSFIKTRKLRYWYRANVKYRHNKFDGKLPYDWDKIPYSRTDIVKHACEAVKATSYLEIGCAGNLTFDAIEVANKVGVDPMQGGTHRMTSDNFFAENNLKFDVIFIDGLHEYEQVHKDIDNALLVLNKGGIILLDDMIPLNWTEEHRPAFQSPWIGDCWKCSFEILATKGLDFKLALCDNGTGIIKPNAKHDKLADLSHELNDKRFAYFYENISKLPLFKAEEVLQWI